MGMSTIRLLHLADIHLGFTGPTNLLLSETENPRAAGRYMREVDIEEAVRKMTKAIVNEHNPLVDVVLIAGDLFNRPNPSPRAISQATQMIHTFVKHDITVVIIDGNHETANIVHTGSPTTFLQHVGAHIVNGTNYQVLRDWTGLSPEKQERMANLAIHAVPYKALRGQPSLTGVLPLPGYINVLLTHGRVAGMKELNSLYQPAHTIPSDVLRRGWDYIALGDWHIHRYQPLDDVPAYYTGSLEALSFGEAAAYPPRTNDRYALRGALDVRLSLHQPAEVSTFEHKEARPVLRLEEIDATDINAETLMDLLRRRLQAELPSHAIVLLEVKNVLPEVWQKLDHAKLAKQKKSVRRCEISPSFQRLSSSQSGEAFSEVSLESQWERFIGDREQNTTEKVWYKEEGMKRIEDARQLLQAAYAQEGE
jgi:DNA repair protein SbcD/Mre11